MRPLICSQILPSFPSFSLFIFLFFYLFHLPFPKIKISSSISCNQILWHNDDKILLQVYALTRERDTLRREQSKKNDAAALLKEKDEIISQVMAEGMP